MDALKLFMAIPGKVNFLQVGRYGEFSEQTYRNNFRDDAFDWFSFNEHLIRKALRGKRLAIAIDPSFLLKSGKRTLWTGKFWSGVAGEMKRGNEVMGVGVIDVDNHDCMTLGAIQTPDARSLEEMEYNLVDWYRQNLVALKERLLGISRLVVADAFFSKETFVAPLVKEGFHVISRLRNDAVLFYPTTRKPTGKRGHPKWFDGKVDFGRLDFARCEEIGVDKGRLFGLRAYSKSLKHFIKVACKELEIPFSVTSCKSVIHNAYMLDRFICVSGLRPDPQVIDRLFKELV